MFYFTHNLIVFVIAAVLSALAWVWGGTRGDLLPWFVPWITLILLEMMFAFPQRLPYESSVDARLRVWRDVRGDKLTWVAVGFLALLALPFLNTSFRSLPRCVTRSAHLNVFLWFLPALTAMIAAKHSLRRHGKRLLAETLVWNGVALAAFGFIQASTGAEAPFWNSSGFKLDFFASFGYANMAGDYFTALEFIAIGLWQFRTAELANADPGRESSHHLFWRRHYLLIAVVILYFSALYTLSRSAILLSTAGTVFLFVCAGLRKMKRLEVVDRVKFAAVLVLAVIGVAIFASLFTPDRMRRELGTITANGVVTRMTGKGEYHVRVAGELLRDYPLFGCGGWGYKSLCSSKLPESVTGVFRYDWCRGMANVHNDYMQFLCEHGSIGFALLIAIVVFAVLPDAKRWRKLARLARFSRRTALPWPKGFFCFPPAGLALYAAALATLIHAFADCPLRSPAILSLFFVELVIVEGFLPRTADDDE